MGALENDPHPLRLADRSRLHNLVRRPLYGWPYGGPVKNTTRVWAVTPYGKLERCDCIYAGKKWGVIRAPSGTCWSITHLATGASVAHGEFNEHDLCTRLVDKLEKLPTFDLRNYDDHIAAVKAEVREFEVAKRVTEVET